MPSIDRNSPEPFYRQIYSQISDGIKTGLYPAGKKLPSIREAARELGVSNTTIELAYQRLTEEGFVVARRGSGYTICEQQGPSRDPNERFSTAYRLSLEELETISSRCAKTDAVRFDFAYDAIDPDTFPLTTWARLSRGIFFEEGAEKACLYNDRQGLPTLREQICHYINSEYGLDCTPAQVLVMPTTRDLVSSILTLFDPSETTVAMENPGYDEVTTFLKGSGFTVKDLPVFPYPRSGEVDEILAGSDIVFTTPACQFPSNRTMPVELRRNIVEWAEANNAYVIDDEYSWEFQSGTSRMPALASIDRTGHVISLGTFSNSFTPAVCLSYAILPPQLMLKWQTRERGAHPQSPWQTQATMAAFMREGHWRSHIRRLRLSVQRKRDELVGAIERHMGDAVTTIVGETSLFVLAQTNDERSEAELIESAMRAGVRVHSTSRYWSTDTPDGWRYVLIGFSGIPFDDIDEGIRTLAGAWGVAR